jgi:RNA polymerase subunit RPABC4/transcription elongation factor Spt4
VNRKIVIGLFAGYALALAVGLAGLWIGIARGAIDFAPHDRTAGPIVLSVGMVVGLLLLCVAAGIGIHVYGDSRKRGMEPVLWTLLAVCVPYFLGLIIYLIVRNPPRAACPSCGARAPGKASFCPSCGSPLQRSCARCRAPLQKEDRFCHACGQEATAG